MERRLQPPKVGFDVVSTNARQRLEQKRHALGVSTVQCVRILQFCFCMGAVRVAVQTGTLARARSGRSVGGIVRNRHD